MARVRSLTAPAARSGSSPAPSASTSTGTGTAPVAHTAAAVGTAVNAGTITSVPGPTPSASNERRSASVPDGDRDRVPPPAVRRQLGLERLGLGPEQVHAGSDDAVDRVAELGLERRHPPPEVDDGRLLGGSAHRYQERCCS